MNKLENRIRRQKIHLRMIEELDNLTFASSNLNEYSKELLRYLLFVFKCKDSAILWREKDSFKVYNSSLEGNDSLGLLVRDMCHKKKRGLIVNLLKKRSLLSKNKIFNFLAVLVISNRSCVGCIFLLNKIKLFEKRDFNFLKLIAKRAGIGYVFVKNHSDLNLKTRELDAVYKADKIRDSSENYDDFVRITLKNLLETIKGEFSFFVSYSDNKDVKDYFLYGIDDDSELYNELRELSDYILMNGDNNFINLNKKKIRNVMCVILAINKNKLGVLGVSNHDFTRDDLVLLKAVASQFDTAVLDSLDRRRIKKMFQRYVCPDIIEELLIDKKDLLKVDRRELTVLFSDLRGFSSVSERLKPEIIVDFLNEHFDAMSRVILKYGGMIDKFVGDQIMVIFGAPIYVEDHVLNALHTAIEMQEKHEELLNRWRNKGINCGIGIGVNFGGMLIGNIGGTIRSDYTVIGDNVNIAARLCSIAERGEILVTGGCYAIVKDNFEFSKINQLDLKGKRKRVDVYSLRIR
ncbi:hypothetical protein J4436_03140 [Candidatus Woesearchaeota archaeon]|nr:hypothetical protein [Candidatus Woesearchaeota archaeon]